VRNPYSDLPWGLAPIVSTLPYLGLDDRWRNWIVTNEN